MSHATCRESRDHTQAPTPPRPLFPLWAAAPAAAVAGLALDAAFPSLGWWPLTFASVTLALLTLIGRGTWSAVLVGAIFGAAFWFPHVSWAAQFLGEHPLNWVPWVALASALTIYSALLTVPIAWAYRWLPYRRDTPAVRLLALPALVAGAWTVRELLMGSWPYGGFPWARIAMSQSESPIAPVASWVGVSGLGFLMALLCAAAIEATRWTVHRRPPRGDTTEYRSSTHALRWTAPIPAFGLAAMLLLVPQFPTSHAGTIRVGAVQGNGPAAYVDEHEPGAVLESQLAASAPLEDEQVDIVLWPEGGVDIDPLADEATAQVLSDAAARYGAPILLNAASADGHMVFNTSFLWTSTGPVAAHAKRHPVPFGEYVPDRWLYETLVPSLVDQLQREYAAGTDTPAIEVDGVDVGLAICFDVAFDDVIHESTRSSAQVLMFQTNNADFRGTDENLQQLAFARMRAIETGRSVVNLSTTGTSQVLAPNGTTVAALPADEPGLMLAELELRDGLTAAVVLGQPIQALIASGTLATFLVLALPLLRDRARHHRAPDSGGLSGTGRHERDR
ncbi:apolipoprotein N-acyltransferase [Streptomyces sp. PT12]|uniref:apolipoprotein N-acyltransferase n=1 Tax=Streptomyces sp. PT12 TaxID=1510197 RepID=UPI000DE1AA50|nr:apolipoprotein N-acyltransferase [Streptomyces sp. PT12]RBM22741.1 apolipoprotein N-acyltransferase [Streptomyces sp. PT12]